MIGSFGRCSSAGCETQFVDRMPRVVYSELPMGRLGSLLRRSNRMCGFYSLLASYRAFVTNDTKPRMMSAAIEALDPAWM
jgi:hypothetical protein